MMTWGRIFSACRCMFVCRRTCERYMQVFGHWATYRCTEHIGMCYCWCGWSCMRPFSTTAIQSPNSKSVSSFLFRSISWVYERMSLLLVSSAFKRQGVNSCSHGYDHPPLPICSCQSVRPPVRLCACCTSFKPQKHETNTPAKMIFNCQIIVWAIVPRLNQTKDRTHAKCLRLAASLWRVTLILFSANSISSHSCGFIKLEYAACYAGK